MKPNARPQLKAKYEVLNITEYEKGGGSGTYEKGVLSSTLSGWQEFYDEVARFRDHRDYVWRGQRRHGDGWTLRSKFDRKSSVTNRDALLEEHLKAFTRAVRGRRGPNPPKLKEDDLWALGQHNGLATPLLDWAEAPFVAAYFAFYKAMDRDNKNDSTRVVYGLNREIEKWYRKGKGSDRKEPFIVFPELEAHENARFLAQRGVFTKALEGKDVKQGIQECYHEENHRGRIILVEIFIPDGDRAECLKDLNGMNINHASLFPDIHGSAIFCNLRLEIDGYYP